MKYLIIFPCFLLLFLKTSAQTITGNPDTTVYGSVETNFSGGWSAYNTYIQKQAHYPAIGLENHTQGCTYLKLSIEKDSTLSNVAIYSGAGRGMDDEALRIISTSGKWIPSKINGTNVKTNCIVVMHFTLKVYGDRLGGTVDGTVSDTSYLSKVMAFESSGIPVSEISNYPHRIVNFVGEVYGSKAASDTVFTLTCGQVGYATKYVNIVLMGKSTYPDNFKKKLSGYLIKGTGTVVNYKGTFIIVIEDRKQYTLMQAFHQKKESFSSAP